MLEFHPWMTIQLTKKSHWDNHKPSRLLSVFLCPLFAFFAGLLNFILCNSKKFKLMSHFNYSLESKTINILFSDMALWIFWSGLADFAQDWNWCLSFCFQTNVYVRNSWSQVYDKIRQHKHAVTSIGFPQSCIISTPIIFPHNNIQINFGRFSAELP